MKGKVQERSLSGIKVPEDTVGRAQGVRVCVGGGVMGEEKNVQ